MRTLVTLLLLAICSSAVAADNTKANATLLLEATSQVMLAERIGKAYVWRGIDPENNDAKSQSEQASKQFIRQLNTLKTFSKNNPALKASKPADKTEAQELLDNFNTLEQVWNEYQKLTAAPAFREGGPKLAETAEEVVLYAQRVADAIAAKIKPDSRAAALAEEIAGLSQRLARIYLLQSWGVKVPFLSKDLAAARSKFESLNQQLIASTQNTASTKAQLELLKGQWFFFQQAIDELAKNNSDKQLQKTVITTSERIFQVASELVVAYQRGGK